MKTTPFAALAVLAFTTTAFAQAPAPTKLVASAIPGCATPALLDADDKGVFKIPNRDVKWRDPVPALKKDGKYVLPNGKTHEPPAGYTVLVRLADECALRFTFKAEAPGKLAGGDYKW